MQLTVKRKAFTDKDITPSLVLCSFFSVSGVKYPSRSMVITSRHYSFFSEHPAGSPQLGRENETAVHSLPQVLSSQNKEIFHV